MLCLWSLFLLMPLKGSKRSCVGKCPNFRFFWMIYPGMTSMPSSNPSQNFTRRWGRRWAAKVPSRTVLLQLFLVLSMAGFSRLEVCISFIPPKCPLAFPGDNYKLCNNIPCISNSNIIEWVLSWGVWAWYSRRFFFLFYYSPNTKSIVNMDHKLGSMQLQQSS